MMTKTEFLNLLEQKLSLINDDERKDILMEYGTYIDDKMASGVSEEEAVSGFGNINELVSDILEAYKINTDNVQTKMDKTLDKVYVRSESFLNRFGNLSVNDMFHILFDVFVLLIILFIGKILIVDFFGNIFISILFGFTGSYLYPLERILDFALTIVYFIAAVLFFLSVMSRRINRYRNKSSIRQVGVMEDIKSTWNQETRQFVSKNDDLLDDLPPLPKTERPLYHQRVSVPEVDRQSMHLFSKILIILCGIPVVSALIGFGIVFVSMAYVSLAKGASSIGLYMIFSGLILGSVAIIWLLGHIWPKKEVKEDA